MPRIFITGATGYIGGDFLFAAVQAHPDWHITCLVRDTSKGDELKSTFPAVELVYGSLESTTVLEREASKADVIYSFANADHLKGAKAIAKGLARNESSAAFWIHTSGAGILTHTNFASNTYGYTLDSDRKVYNDWEGVDELTSLPDKALHRHVDKVVLAASSGKPRHIKTAIVAPPCIYGVGRGTGNTSSVQVHVAAQVALENGRGVRVGEGSNIWHEVHIHDLSQLYVLLGEAAAVGGGKATWNGKGYYLAESGSFVWGDIIHRIAHEGWLRGYLSSSEVESVEFEKSKTLHQHFPYLCATTSRGVSKRAGILLGWKPTQRRMVHNLPEIVQQEAKKLGLVATGQKTSSL